MRNQLLVRPEKLDKVQKPIDKSKYFRWRETILDCASQNSDWAEFTKPNAQWKARNEDSMRAVTDAAKRAHLNSYLTYVATFAPGCQLLSSAPLRFVFLQPHAGAKILPACGCHISTLMLVQ